MDGDAAERLGGGRPPCGDVADVDRHVRTQAQAGHGQESDADRARARDQERADVGVDAQRPVQRGAAGAHDVQEHRGQSEGKVVPDREEHPLLDDLQRAETAVAVEAHVSGLAQAELGRARAAAAASRSRP
ncbi:hypothetical protein [Nonomuraea sp. NPDC049695]|uniref:hypothetical protein n=1 Tax=Nonomuraea sp. NPDC049695 TaxID=3154734 RepID=UPI003445DF75